MQFQVPQYIEVKERIIGPLTLGQFFWLAGAFGLSFLFFFVFEFWLWFLVSVFFFSIGGCFAFIEINGRSLIKIFSFGLKYYWEPRVYLWQREKIEAEIEFQEIKQELSKGKGLQELKEKNISAKFVFGKTKKEEKYQVFRKITGEREVARRIDYL